MQRSAFRLISLTTGLPCSTGHNGQCDHGPPDRRRRPRRPTRLPVHHRPARRRPRCLARASASPAAPCRPGSTGSRSAASSSPSRPRSTPGALGYPVTAFCTLEIRQRQGHAPVVAHLSAIPEVLEIHSITGVGDLVVRIVARDNADLGRVIDEIIDDTHVLRANTAICLVTHLDHRTGPLVDGRGRAGSTTGTPSPRPQRPVTYVDVRSAAADEPLADLADPLGDLLARRRRELGPAARPAQVQVDARVGRARLRGVGRDELVQLLALRRRAPGAPTPARARPARREAGGGWSRRAWPGARAAGGRPGRARAGRAARGSPAPPRTRPRRGGRTGSCRTGRGRSARRTPAPRSSSPRGRRSSRCGWRRRSSPPPRPTARPRTRRTSGG